MKQTKFIHKRNYTVMQEQDEKTAGPISTKSVEAGDGTKGKLVRPNEKVKVIFTDSKYHKVGAEEEIHPALAAKFIYTQKIAKLKDPTKDQKRVDDFKPEATTEAAGKKAKEVTV